MSALAAGVEPLDIDVEQLDGWMAKNVSGFERLVHVQRLPGGQSNPTYLVDATSGAYAVRRKPFGPLLASAHAIDREYRLISSLHPTGYPVPASFALCEDESVIGAMFYVMEFKAGRNFTNGQLPNLRPDERTAVYYAMIDQLAALHMLDPAAVGLEDYGRPGNYFQRQVDRWTRQYRASQTDDLPVVEQLIDYLGRSVPDQTRTAIIHGDYRIDNLIYAPAQPDVIAIIDWELSTLGDPLADFAYLAMQWTMPAGAGAGLQGVDFEATGIPTLDEAVARYCRLTDREDLPSLEWYFAYNLFRLMGIVQGIKKRIMDGNASSPDAATAAARVLPLAEAAWTHALAAGAAE